MLFTRLLSFYEVAGPSKLPELGKELGKTVKSFQTAAKVRTVIGACGTAASTQYFAWCLAEASLPSASHYTALAEALVLKMVRLLQEFETELKTATDDAVDDASKTLEEKKEELR